MAIKKSLVGCRSGRLQGGPSHQFEFSGQLGLTTEGAATGD